MENGNHAIGRNVHVCASVTLMSASPMLLRKLIELGFAVPDTSHADYNTILHERAVRKFICAKPSNPKPLGAGLSLMPFLVCRKIRKGL